MFKYSILLLIILFNTVYVLTEECEITADIEPIKHEKRLREDLLCNYNKHFVPLNNRSEEMWLSMAMQIMEYDIYENVPKKLYLQSEITVKWHDVFLMWNPEDYNGLTEMIMKTDDIWSPEILPEEMEFFSHNPSILASTECDVLSSGNVTCMTTSYHTGFCRSDDRRWPYDEHDCGILYMVWSYNGERIRINYPVNDTLTIMTSKGEKEWKIIGHTSDYFATKPQLSLTISEIGFEFVLIRNVNHMKYYFLSVFVLTSLSLMCFWSNFEATERVILCLLNILCHIYEIQNMEWKFSRLGHTVPYILCFYRDSMVLSLVILVETMVFKKILSSDKPTPSWLITVDRTLGRPIIKKILFVDGIMTPEQKNGEQGSFEEELKFIKESKLLEKKRIIQIIDRLVFLGFVLAYFIMITILLTY